MVLVDAPDLQEPQGGALVAQAELLGDPAARRVARDDRGLEPVEAQLVEAVAEQERDPSGHEPVPGVLPVDPVADERGLERARAARCRG